MTLADEMAFYGCAKSSVSTFMLSFGVDHPSGGRGRGLPDHVPSRLRQTFPQLYRFGLNLSTRNRAFRTAQPADFPSQRPVLLLVL